MRILIADDHAVVRSGLRSILGTRAGWQVCAEAADGAEAIHLAKRVRPDVAVVDLNMPGLNGLELASRLTQTLPGIGVVVLTFDFSAPFVDAIWKSGALGLVLKSDADRDLIAAVTSVQRGQRFLAPQAQAEFQPASIPAPPGADWQKLRSPSVEVRAQVRLLAERMKRIL